MHTSFGTLRICMSKVKIESNGLAKRLEWMIQIAANLSHFNVLFQPKTFRENILQVPTEILAFQSFSQLLSFRQISGWNLFWSYGAYETNELTDEIEFHFEKPYLDTPHKYDSGIRPSKPQSNGCYFALWFYHDHHHQMNTWICDKGGRLLNTAISRAIHRTAIPSKLSNYLHFREFVH